MHHPRSPSNLLPILSFHGLDCAEELRTKKKVFLKNSFLMLGALVNFGTFSFVTWGDVLVLKLWLRLMDRVHMVSTLQTLYYGLATTLPLVDLRSNFFSSPL